MDPRGAYDRMREGFGKDLANRYVLFAAWPLTRTTRDFEEGSQRADGQERRTGDRPPARRPTQRLSGGRSRRVDDGEVSASTMRARHRPAHEAAARTLPPGNEAGSSTTLCRHPGLDGAKPAAPGQVRHAARVRPAVKAGSAPSHRPSIACEAPADAAAGPRCRFSACSLDRMERYREIRRIGAPDRLSNRSSCRQGKAPLQPVQRRLGITDPVQFRPVWLRWARLHVFDAPLRWQRRQSCPLALSSSIGTNADTRPRKRGR